jgi:hypothetical protein
MAEVPIQRFRKYWSRKPVCHAITNKYPEAGSVLQQIYKILNDIEILAGCTPAKVEERSEWTSFVNSVEENRSESTFSALFGMCMVTLYEMKAVLKVSAQI